MSFSLPSVTSHPHRSIVEKYTVRTPNLVEWYEKRAFEKDPPYASCVKEAGSLDTHRTELKFLI